MAAIAETPNGLIGGNGAPDDDGFDDFISVRIVQEAAEYLKFRFLNLDRVLATRASKREMGFRKVLCYCLDGVVPNKSLSYILDINRKTVGEDAQRPDRWAELDDEFHDDVEHIRQAVIGHVSVNVERFEQRLSHWVLEDVKLRAQEAKRKVDAALAAAKADRRADTAESRRIRELAPLRKALKGNPQGPAIIAKHEGARHTAKGLTDEGVAVLELLSLRAADQKGSQRAAQSELNHNGLAECVKLGLARNAEAYLSKSTDPMFALVGPFGGQVYLEAIALGRIKPKKKRDV